MDTQLINYGISGVALLLIIKELFAYLKTKKEGGMNQALLDEVKLMNSNHLKHLQASMTDLCKDLNTGNDRVVSAIKDMHIDLAGRLGKLEGKLDNK